MRIYNFVNTTSNSVTLIPHYSDGVVAPGGASHTLAPGESYAYSIDPARDNNYFVELVAYGGWFFDWTSNICVMGNGPQARPPGTHNIQSLPTFPDYPSGQGPLYPFRGIIHNLTNLRLTFHDIVMTHGHTNPPESSENPPGTLADLPPLGQTSWAAESGSVFHGTEGTVSYNVPGAAGLLVVSFDLPIIGAKDYGSAPSPLPGYSIGIDKQTGDYPEVTYTFNAP